jgi:hypothetical protein
MVYLLKRSTVNRGFRRSIPMARRKGQNKKKINKKKQKKQRHHHLAVKFGTT